MVGYSWHLVGRAQGCWPLSFNAQNNLGPHMPETAKNNSWGGVLYSGGARVGSCARSLRHKRLGNGSGGRRRNVAGYLSRSSVIPRHAGIPWEVSPKNGEPEGEFPLSDRSHLKRTSVCHPNLPAPRESGSDTRGSIFGTSSVHTRTVSNRAQMLTEMTGNP